MIDANLIRALGNKTAQQEVDGVLEFLVKWIKKNPSHKTFFKFGNFWGKEGVQRTKKWLEAKKILNDLGFHVYNYEKSSDYQEKLPPEAVNNGPFTIISWHP